MSSAKFRNIPKAIAKRIQKPRSLCGGKIRLILYHDRTYRGGHYFGGIPIYRKRDLRTAASTYDKKLNGWVLRGIKPIRHVEYWECPQRYWK